MTEETLQQVFIEYGVFALSRAIESNETVDPKVYETIHKYVEKRELGPMPEPEDGSVAAKSLEELRRKYGESTD